MNITVREAKEEDVATILRIINYEISHSTVVYDYKERSLDFQLNWYRKKMEDGMPIIVAENDHEVVGFGTFGIFRPWEAYRFCIEHSIYVDQSARGKRVGKQLLSELIALAEQGGFHTMIAGIDATNEGSIRFHKQFGFQEVGLFKEVGFKFDKWLDLIFLQLFLK